MESVFSMNIFACCIQKVDQTSCNTECCIWMCWISTTSGQCAVQSDVTDVLFEILIKNWTVKVPFLAVCVTGTCLLCVCFEGAGGHKLSMVVLMKPDLSRSNSPGNEFALRHFYGLTDISPGVRVFWVMRQCTKLLPGVSDRLITGVAHFS